MNYWQYKTQLEQRYHPERGHYATYMLLARRRMPTGWEKIEIIHDVTTKYHLAKKIASLCTKYQASPQYMREFLEGKSV